MLDPGVFLDELFFPLVQAGDFLFKLLKGLSGLDGAISRHFWKSVERKKLNSEKIVGEKVILIISRFCKLLKRLEPTDGFEPPTR